MRLNSKFLLLMLVLFCIFISSYSYIYQTQKHQLTNLNNSYKEDFDKSFQKIIDLSNTKFSSFVYDYSYWDEMATFANKPDMEWAKINIDEPMVNFNIDYVWVVNAKSEFIYTKSENLEDITSLINPKDFNQTKPIFNSYFIKSKHNIIKIYLAPIQASEDIKRVGKPKGYLIVGKIWSKAFINDLENITRQEIKIVDNNQIGADIISHPLIGYDKKILSYISLKLDKSFLKTLDSSVETLNLFVLFIGSLSLILMVLFIYIVVLKPMNVITLSLSSKNANLLSKLNTKADEFGLISRLIKDFFTQQDILVTQLKRAEDAEKKQQILQEQLTTINLELEEKILIRTKELENLNKDLDKRIEEEINARLKQEEILIQQAKLASMGEMIANIAHQWRQPLSVISSIASGISFKKEMGILNVEKINFDMENIVKQAVYLSKTIDDFRNFLNNENEGKDISVKSVVEKTILILESVLNNNQIKLISSLEDDLVVAGHENELMQAFINIINNAKDAIRENNHNENERLIFIATSKKDDYLELTIKDSGGGVPKDIIPRIFEPYFTTKHQSVGTGIGLYMTGKIITERHNATIMVENTEYEYASKIYKGAMFTIKFIN